MDAEGEASINIVAVAQTASSRKPPQEPPSFDDTPDALLQKVMQLAEHYTNGLKAIVAQIDPKAATFENLVVTYPFH